MERQVNSTPRLIAMIFASELGIYLGNFLLSLCYHSCLFSDALEARILVQNVELFYGKWHYYSRQRRERKTD